MRFSTLSLLAFPFALSTPLAPRAATEFIEIQQAIFSQSDSGLTRIGFIVASGENSFQCAQNNPVVSSPRPYPCDDEAYSWRLMSEGPYGWGPYTLTVYHATGVAVGLQGNVTVPCNGPMPKLCEQKGFHNTTLCSDLTVCGAGAEN